MLFPLLFALSAAALVLFLFGRRTWFNRRVAVAGLLSVLLAVAALGVALALYWSTAMRVRPETMPLSARTPAVWTAYAQWASSTFWTIWLGAPAAGVVAALVGGLVARVRWWQSAAFAATVIILLMLFFSPVVEMANACMTGSSQIIVGAVVC